MIKVLLSGCLGKMGKVVIDASKKFSNLEIVAGVDTATCENSVFPIYNNIFECNLEIDVIVDFSRPSALGNLLKYSKGKNIPIVLCTTGFSTDQLAEINQASKELPIFRSANMSFGINLINNLLKEVSSLLYNDFDIEIIEKHHNQKVDSPSGTALMLANTIKDSIEEETKFVYGREGIAKRNNNEIGIHAIRGGSIVGDHNIIFAGSGEVIEISHSAISREVFAYGALKACEFMYHKQKGLYNMDNIIQEYKK